MMMRIYSISTYFVGASSAVDGSTSTLCSEASSSVLLSVAMIGDGLFLWVSQDGFINVDNVGARVCPSSVKLV